MNKAIEKSFGPQLLIFLAFGNAFWTGEFSPMDFIIILGALMMWFLDEEVRLRKVSL